MGKDKKERISPKRGRLPAPERTLKIYPYGTARLSQDLVVGLSVGKGFAVSVVKAKKAVYLKPAKAGKGSLKLWYSSPGAVSPYISFVGVLAAFGLTSKGAAGLYRAEVKAGVVHIDLSRRIKG